MVQHAFFGTSTVLTHSSKFSRTPQTTARVAQSLGDSSLAALLLAPSARANACYTAFCLTSKRPIAARARMSRAELLASKMAAHDLDSPAAAQDSVTVTLRVTHLSGGSVITPGVARDLS
jgi:hypothetical protein